jgi:hypothetical protein
MEGVFDLNSTVISYTQPKKVIIPHNHDLIVNNTIYKGIASRVQYTLDHTKTNCALQISIEEV